MFFIGPHAIKAPVLLAPMAGVTDLPFRELCLQFGAGLATSEMITSQASLWHTQKSQNRFKQSDKTGIASVQIAGSEPDIMAQAARLAEENGAQVIDINMGCPAKKVCKKLAGSALLQDEQKVEQILHAVVSAVTIPVTLKTRTGWSPQNKNGCTIAKIAEQAGIAALAVHGRTRSCKFNGHAEYDTIAKIVSSVSIPVIANGDIQCAQDAVNVLQHTNASAVMIGRAAFGNPWIFQDVCQTVTNEHSNETNNIFTQPHFSEVRQVMTQHLKGIHAFYEGLQGVRIARKHIKWYAQTLASFGADAFNTCEFNLLNDSQSQLDALANYFKGLNLHEDHAA